MAGSIIGVGSANQVLSVKSGTGGVDWAQASNFGRTPLIFTHSRICLYGDF
jgi:hypothetical protein